MDTSEIAETKSPPRRSPDSALPPVEAPTASFVLQLFLIPLLIVSIVVLLWLVFSWMAHLGRDNPGALLKRLRRERPPVGLAGNERFGYVFGRYNASVDAPVAQLDRAAAF